MLHPWTQYQQDSIQIAKDRTSSDSMPTRVHYIYSIHNKQSNFKIIPTIQIAKDQTSFDLVPKHTTEL